MNALMNRKKKSVFVPSFSKSYGGYELPFLAIVRLSGWSRTRNYNGRHSFSFATKRNEICNNVNN